MNILIIGIHGFVGFNLVMALKSRHTLYGLNIVAPEKEGVTRTYLWSELEILRCALNDKSVGIQFDAIIHLAGKAHDTKNQSDAYLFR